MGHRLSNGLEIRITEFCVFPTLPWDLALSSQAGEVLGKGWSPAQMTFHLSYDSYIYIYISALIKSG